MPTKKAKSIIEYRNYYLPVDFPVLLLTGEIWEISDVPADNLHFHNCLEIGICQSESGTLVFYNEQKIHFQCGDITCIPRNIPHSTYSAPARKSKWSYLFFEPRQLFMNTIPGNLTQTLVQDDVRNYLIPKNTSPRISFLAQTVIEELSQEAPDYLLAKSYLFALYTEIIRYQSKNSLPLSRTAAGSPHSKNALLPKTNTLSIAPALDFIEDNYMNKFPIELLAELCHLSPTHFRRVFQSVMRVSPLAYLNTIRIINACNLLQNTNHTILSIAEMTGFSTLSNFNRHFSQIMNLSPREYRKQMRKGKKTGATPSTVEYTGWMEP